MKKKLNVLLITDKLKLDEPSAYFMALENHMNRENINFFTAAFIIEGSEKLKHANLFTLLKNKPYKNLSVIKKIIIDNNINLVHSNSFSIVLLVTLLRLFHRFKFNIVYTEHNTKLIKTWTKKLYSWFINTFISKIICLCTSEKEYLKSIKIRENKIIVINNSIDLCKFTFSSKYFENTLPFNIGMLDDFYTEEELKFFIDIIENLKRNTHKDFMAYIGSYLPSKMYIRDYGLIKKHSDRVKILDNLEDSLDFLRQMDCMVLASNKNILPITLLETMATGSLVISLDLGAPSEVITNKINGILLPYDKYLFMDAIKRSMEFTRKHKNLIINARNLVEDNFSMESMIIATEKAYRI